MPCRFSRQRLPPEYRKQYLEKISNEALDKYRKSDFVAYPALKTQRLWEVQPQEPKKETKYVICFVSVLLNSSITILNIGQKSFTLTIV